MSMNLYIYVGPYLETDGDFDWWPFESLVADGRGEAYEPGESKRLIPNVKVPGITRQTTWDRHSETPVVAIGGLQADEEKAAFGRLVGPVLTHCNERKIPVRLLWGVVPYIS